MGLQRGRHDLPGALGGLCLMAVELGAVAIERRAIRADEFVVAAHVAEYMRMVVGRGRADAHEFLGADLDHGDAGVVVKMRNGVVGHVRSCELSKKESSPAP